MKFIFSLALILLTGNGALLAQREVVPKDVVGWEGARWGMSAKKIQKVFAKTINKESLEFLCEGLYFHKDYYGNEHCGFRFADVPFGNKSFVIMDVDKKRGLYRILIGYGESESKANIPLFEKAEKMLIERYGPVNGLNYSGNNPEYLEREREWKFPSTLITLHYSFSNYNFSLLRVDFFPLFHNKIKPKNQFVKMMNGANGSK